MSNDSTAIRKEEWRSARRSTEWAYFERAKSEYRRMLLGPGSLSLESAVEMRNELIRLKEVVLREFDWLGRSLDQFAASWPAVERKASN
jgi:hypothetical protein